MPIEAMTGRGARGEARENLRGDCQDDVHACPVEAITRAYLGFAGGDARIALRCAVADALSDLMDAERRTRERSRLISRGYIRKALADRVERPS